MARNEIPAGSFRVTKTFSLVFGQVSVVFRAGRLVRSNGRGKVESTKEDGTWAARKFPGCSDMSLCGMGDAWDRDAALATFKKNTVAA